jgi:16S rRNA (uracil1498-N3)-methyltransferase
MRRFYAPKENFSADAVELGFDDTRHLRDVLRLKAEDTVNVFDGTGHEFLCMIEKIGKRHTSLRIVKETEATAPESGLDLTFAAAITKGEKFDLVVQKMVELGVNNLIPLFTRRCEVKPGGSEKRLDRWRKIALEAAKQCGRTKLMRVLEPVDFQDFVLSAMGRVVLFSERDGDNSKTLKAAETLTAVIGPAGGWDDAELELARKRGFQIITFGGRILRAETAAIAFAAILQHRFGDLS